MPSHDQVTTINAKSQNETLMGSLLDRRVGGQVWTLLSQREGEEVKHAENQRPRRGFPVAVLRSGKRMKRKSKTDWARVKAMKDSAIDYSDSTPLGNEFFKKAVVWPGTKKQLTLRLDPDVVEFFKKQGRGYQTMINVVLRKYVEAHGH